MNQKINSSIALEERICKFLDSHIRPSLLSHGGDLYIKEIKGKDIGVVFNGSCATCPSAQITVEEVVAKQLKEEFGDEIGRVYLINETHEDLISFAKELLSRKKTSK